MDERRQMVTLAAVEDALHAAVAELEQAPDDAALRARVETLRALRVKTIRNDE